MICPKCGNEMNDNDKWCMRCGMVNPNISQSQVFKEPGTDKSNISDSINNSNGFNGINNINYDNRSSSSSNISKILFYIVNGIILLAIISLFFIDDNLSNLSSILMKFLKISLLILFFYVICYEKIFEKAGKHWWQMFIPIYNIYLIYKISTGDGSLFWASIIVTFVLGFLGGIFPDSMTNFINVIESIISLIFSIILSVGLADRFNANRILMVFFGFIMIPIIAFSKSYTYEY